MLSRLLLALIFLLVAAPSANAQQAAQHDIVQPVEARFAASFQAAMPLLRSDVIVAADLVTLGDLFDHAGSMAETPVFRAPAPGTRGRVSAAAIVEAARRAGLSTFDLAGLSDIAVERAGTLLSAGDLTALVQTALDSQLEAVFGADAGQITLTLTRQPARAMVPSEAVASLRVDLVAAPSARSDRFMASVRLASGNEIARLEGRAVHTLLVPVLGRALARGEVIQPSDLRRMEVPYARTMGTPTVIEESLIIGQAARRALRAGAPIAPDDLTAPLMVERQELVTLVYRHGSLALTVRARALDDGAQGQSIDVMNLQSNRVVRGLVAGHGLIHVLGPMQDIAALNVGIANAIPSTSQERAQ